MTEPFTGPEYAQWRHHPATKKFMKFLEDYEAWLRGSFEQHWLEGQLGKLDEGGVRGRVLMCSELRAMRFEEVEAFYKQQEADSEAESNPPQVDDVRSDA